MSENRVSSTKWFGLALQSLLVLADFDGIAPSSALAEKLGAKSAFLRKVLSNLVKAGILSAKEGRDGGYFLAKNPDEIALVEVYEAMRTDPYAKGFLDVNKEECFAPGTQTALLHLVEEMESWILRGLSEKTVGDLLRDR
ncbi:RrF2 family transcriptional regulator [Fictibacillus iocasae]|uniref:RrF2 family transcriptional regulator n=1 Tax=Fictibacillus iocasae TaxID=2715437 RepID=A0ABW2NRU0_9BACL